MFPYVTEARPLVVDSDAKFLAGLEKGSKPVFTLQDGTDLRRFEEKQVCGIFYNPAAGRVASFEFVSECHRVFPGIPIYFVHEGFTSSDAFMKTLPDKDFGRFGIQRNLTKPLPPDLLVKELGAEVEVLDPEAYKQQAAELEKTFSRSIDKNDRLFSPVRAVYYLNDRKTCYDLYLRIRNGVYIKIVSAGDQLSTKRLTQYFTRGVSHFFILKSDQERFVSVCDAMAKEVLRSKKTSQSIKISRTLEHGSAVVDFLQKTGVRPKVIEESEKFVGNALQLVHQLDLKKGNAIRSFLDNLVGLDHAVSTTMIAALVGRSPTFDFDEKKSLEWLGLAGLLHDVGLYSLMGPDAFDEKEENLGTEQKELFHRHPVEGAKLLEQTPGVSAFVVQAVAQHHERRDRTGFPSKPQLGTLSYVGQIIGLSDEFCHFLKQDLDQHRGDPVGAFVQQQRNKFTEQVLGALRNVFQSKK